MEYLCILIDADKCAYQTTFVAADTNEAGAKKARIIADRTPKARGWELWHAGKLIARDGVEHDVKGARRCMPH